MLLQLVPPQKDTPPAPRNEACVDFLRDALEKAERGEIDFVILVALCPDNGVIDGWSASAKCRPYVVLGALNALAHRFGGKEIEGY